MIQNEAEQAAEPMVAQGVVLTQDEAKKVADDGTAVVAGRTVSQTHAEQRSSTCSSVTSSVLDESALNMELDFEFGRYIGEVDPLSGLRHGQGTMHYNNGNIYDGAWKQGAPDGIGEKRYQNGDVYRGGWVGGKRNGRGGYLYAQGHYFDGMYEDDEANGYGILTTVVNDRYSGEWRGGKKEGKGREVMHNGQVFVGRWRGGKKQGKGKLYMPGAKQFIYGVWNEDHFFRELTDEEMGLDGGVDIVDTFGVARSCRELEEEARALVRDAGEGAALGTLQGQGVTDSFTQRLLSGVTAMESRLEALGRALERVTVPNAPEQTENHIVSNEGPSSGIAEHSVDGVVEGHDDDDSIDCISEGQVHEDDVDGAIDAATLSTMEPRTDGIP